MDVAICSTYLPPEMLGCIVSHVDNITTLNALTRVSWLLNALSTAPLYRLAMTEDDLFNVDSNAGLAAKAFVPDDHDTPLPLWAASRDPAVAIPVLEHIAKLHPDAPWTTYWQSGDSCRTHWLWECRFSSGVGRCAAIHVAARSGNTPVVDWLLDHNPGKVGIDILSYRACLCPSAHMQFLIKEHGLSRPWDSPAATALHLALGAGHFETSQHLISNGANWSRPVEDAHGVSGLMIMVSNGMLNLVDWIQSLRLNGDPIATGRSWVAAEELDDMGFRAINYLAVAPDTFSTRLLARQIVAWSLELDVNLECHELAFSRDWSTIETFASYPENRPLSSAIRYYNTALEDEILAVELKGVDLSWIRERSHG